MHPYCLARIICGNRRVSATGVKKVTYHDIKVIGVVHGALGPKHHYKSADGPHKYTHALVDWVVAQLYKNKNFLLLSRSTFHRFARSNSRDRARHQVSSVD
jgi:hypothetical protein